MKCQAGLIRLIPHIAHITATLSLPAGAEDEQWRAVGSCFLRQGECKSQVPLQVH